jgi:hypothetical protein
MLLCHVFRGTILVSPDEVVQIEAVVVIEDRIMLSPNFHAWRQSSCGPRRVGANGGRLIASLDASVPRRQRDCGPRCRGGKPVAPMDAIVP